MARNNGLWPKIHDQPAEVVAAVLDPAAARLAVHRAGPNGGLIEERGVSLKADMHVPKEGVDRHALFKPRTMSDHILAIQEIRGNRVLGVQFRGFGRKGRRIERRLCASSCRTSDPGTHGISNRRSAPSPSPEEPRHGFRGRWCMSAR